MLSARTIVRSSLEASLPPHCQPGSLTWSHPIRRASLYRASSRGLTLAVRIGKRLGQESACKSRQAQPIGPAQLGPFTGKPGKLDKAWSLN